MEGFDMKKIIKILSVMLLFTVLLGNTTIAKAEFGYEVVLEQKEQLTRTVKTQKQLKEAVKDTDVAFIVIKPDKATTFDFKGINSYADFEVYLSKATLKNVDKATLGGRITPYVENQKQLETAAKWPSVSSIYVETKEKQKFVVNNEMSGKYLFINTPGCDWTFNKFVNYVEFENIKNGTITDNVGINFRLRSEVKKITVGAKSENTLLDIDQDNVSSKAVKINIKGILKHIWFTTNTPVELTFEENSRTEAVEIINTTGDKVSIKLNGKKKKVEGGYLTKEGKMLSY